MNLTIAPRRYDDPDVIALVDEVQAEYVVRYGSQDTATIDVLEFVPPRGLFLLALLDGRPVAMGGWRRVEDGHATVSAEIKRMYVAAGVRRRGVANRLIVEIERTAAEAGIEQLILSTGTAQPEAIALYEQNGFTAIPGFGHYAGYRDARFYRKVLGEPRGWISLG